MTPSTSVSTPTSTTPGCTYVWTEYANSQGFNGRSILWTRTVLGCELACIAFVGCSGIDWDSSLTDVGQACWLCGPWSTGYDFGGAFGVKHYELTRLGPGC
jgi:hypothetical protein